MYHGTNDVSAASPSPQLQNSFSNADSHFISRNQSYTKQLAPCALHPAFAILSPDAAHGGGGTLVADFGLGRPNGRLSSNSDSMFAPYRIPTPHMYSVS
jgi:hypothetical protein